jgi:hypothetical protein
MASSSLQDELRRARVELGTERAGRISDAIERQRHATADREALKVALLQQVTVCAA